MNRKRSQRRCTYCGSSENITKDHVPPKLLFANKKATQLVTVPCCAVCHAQTTLDDEYFRQVLTLGGPASEHPEARAAGEKALRALDKPNKVGMTKNFVGSFRMADVVSGAGIFLGRRPAYTYDPERLEGVCRRVVAGLFYEHTGRRLPMGHEATCMMVGTWVSPVEAISKLVAQTATAGFTVEPHVLGAGVLRYWFRVADDDPIGSVWYLEFYDEVPFVGLTGSRDRTAPRTADGRLVPSNQ